MIIDPDEGTVHATTSRTIQELHFETPAGGSSRAEVHVTNRGDEPLLVRLALADSRFLEDGSLYATHQAVWVVTRIEGHWGIQARSSFAP